MTYAPTIIDAPNVEKMKADILRTPFVAVAVAAADVPVLEAPP